MKEITKLKNTREPFSITSCIFAVFLLILLLCGDVIISRFIPLNPNDNYTKEKDQEVMNEKNLDVFFDDSFIKKIALSDLIETIDQEETVFVLFVQKNSFPCQTFLSVLKEVVNEIPVSHLYFLERSEITEDTEGYFTFLDYSEMLKVSFSLTPYFMVFQHGRYEMDYIGLRDHLKEDLIQIFQTYQ